MVALLFCWCVIVVSIKWVRLLFFSLFSLFVANRCIQMLTRTLPQNTAICADFFSLHRSRMDANTPGHVRKALSVWGCVSLGFSCGRCSYRLSALQCAAQFLRDEARLTSAPQLHFPQRGLVKNKACSQTSLGVLLPALPFSLRAKKVSDRQAMTPWLDWNVTLRWGGGVPVRKDKQDIWLTEMWRSFIARLFLSSHLFPNVWQKQECFNSLNTKIPSKKLVLLLLIVT